MIANVSETMTKSSITNQRPCKAFMDKRHIADTNLGVTLLQVPLLALPYICCYSRPLLATRNLSEAFLFLEQVCYFAQNLPLTKVIRALT